VFGHSGSQAPQFIHSSVIIIAIRCFPDFTDNFDPWFILPAAAPCVGGGKTQKYITKINHQTGGAREKFNPYMELEDRIKAFAQLGDEIKGLPLEERKVIRNNQVP